MNEQSKREGQRTCPASPPPPGGSISAAACHKHPQPASGHPHKHGRRNTSSRGAGRDENAARAPAASVHTRSAASWTLAALQRGRRGAYTGRAGVPHLTAWTVRAALCSAATAAAPTLAGLLLARGFRTLTQWMMTRGFYSTVEVSPKFPGQRSHEIFEKKTHEPCENLHRPGLR